MLHLTGRNLPYTEQAIHHPACSQQCQAPAPSPTSTPWQNEPGLVCGEYGEESLLKLMDVNRCCGPLWTDCFCSDLSRAPNIPTWILQSEKGWWKMLWPWQGRNPKGGQCNKERLPAAQSLSGDRLSAWRDANSPAAIATLEREKATGEKVP